MDGNVRRTSFQRGADVDGVAEVQGGGAGVDHGLGALPLVAAVVEDDGETFVLHCVDDATDVFGGECPAVVVGEQPRGRLGHYHSGRARLLQRAAVGQ